MKLNKCKSFLFLVLGLMVLALPANAQISKSGQNLAEKIGVSKAAKDIDEWIKLNLRDGTIKADGTAEYNEMIKERNEVVRKIKELEKHYETTKDIIAQGVLAETVLGELKVKDAIGEVVKRISSFIFDPNEMDIDTQNEDADSLIKLYNEAIAELNDKIAKMKAQKNSDGSDGCMGSQYIQTSSGQYGANGYWQKIDRCEGLRADIKRIQDRIDWVKRFKIFVSKIAPLRQKLAVLPEPGGLKGESYVYTTPKGQKILFEKDGDTIRTVGGVSGGCIPMPAKLAEIKSCLFCPLFKTIFNASQKVATNAFRTMGKDIAKLMLIGFALYVAFSVIKLVSAFTKQDGPKFITGLLLQAFKVLFAYALLVNSGEIYKWIIGPMIAAGMEFGMSLLFEAGNAYLKSCETSKIAVEAGILPSYVYVKLECFIRAVQAEIAVPQTVGSTLMCVARNAGAGSLDVIIAKVNLWDFSMMFQGLIIFCFAWLISLAFAFYLMDAVVRLGIVGALMPFLIACWPFGPTKSYTKKGWDMFMNSFFTFVMVGLVVSINVQLMGQALTGAKGGFGAIIDALNGNVIKDLKDLLDIGLGGFLILIACCLFGFQLTGKASSLAGQMSGGGGGDIGANIGGLAASGAKAGATKIGGMAISAGKATAKQGGRVIKTTAKNIGNGALRGMGFAAGKMFGKKGGTSASSGNTPSNSRTPINAQQNRHNSAPETMHNSNADLRNRDLQDKLEQERKMRGDTSALGSSTNLDQQKLAQEAGPRNNGNGGSHNPVMRQDVQQSMQEADNNIHNYVGNKQDNDAAWAKYQGSETSLHQAKSDYENAKRMAAGAKGTPDEAKYAAAAEKAAAKYAGVQKSHSKNEEAVQATQDKMNNAAMSAYVNQQKAIAQRNGKAFDENAAREYARTHLDEVKSNLDAIIKSNPKYN